VAALETPVLAAPPAALPPAPKPFGAPLGSSAEAQPITEQAMNAALAMKEVLISAIIHTIFVGRGIAVP
jgi:hypothetical protein